LNSPVLPLIAALALSAFVSNHGRKSDTSNMPTPANPMNSPLWSRPKSIRRQTYPLAPGRAIAGA
jgi:hypothetical protein